MQYMLCCGAMTGDESPDKVIRERRFKLPSGVSIGNLNLSSEKDSADAGESSEESDEALGEFFDPFTNPSEDSPGSVRKDGSVETPPERDIVSQIAIRGEERVNWILMVSMVVLYSAISIQIGRIFDSTVGTLLLIFLASIGFALGEKWIPKEKMKLLGITWIIISMKVLYGLAIELRNWELITSDLSLGVVLLLLVGVNIFVAYRHDQDAIAAQSTLVLLAIGSTAGTEFGEVGVAGMILVATAILHGIALNRDSGNLASLGIASSNLWIGMHAITAQFSVGPLEVIPIEGELLLFLLLMTVTSMNAYMATKFAKEVNWFSHGFEAFGLGKPGLWGVSISIGMAGALLAVTSNREDLGYALGMVTFLGGAFGGSYLVVRGVEARRVYIPLSVTASILTVMLLNGDLFDGILVFSEYQIFTFVGASATVAIILRDQNSVTDRVLWTGSVAILGILVLLVPTGSPSEGDGGVLLLGILSFLHIGTASLAIRRGSPSLSGVTVLLPWSWILVAKLIEESVRTVMLANDISDYSGAIYLETTPLAIYLVLSSILMFVVNSRIEESGINLASGFLGITEISATIRDSELLNLWSIGLWLPMLTILLLAQFGGFTTVSLVALLALLSGLHISSFIMGLRNGNEQLIVWVLAITFLIVQWRHGLDEVIMLLMCTTVGSILYFGEESTFSLGMGMVSIPMLIFGTGRNSTSDLKTPDWFNGLTDGGLLDTIPETEVFALISVTLMLGVFLPRAKTMESLLKPATSSLILIVIAVFLTMDSSNLLRLSSAMMFFATSIWLISKGEIRSELRTIARRESVVGMIAGRTTVTSGSFDSYRPKVAEMEELRKKKRELAETSDESELLTSEITHTPVVGLVVLGIVIFGSVLSVSFGSGPLVLIVSGVFCCIVVFLIRNRTRGLELELPHFLGMEMPIALTISGVCMIIISGHVFPPSGSPDELLDVAIGSVLIFVLLTISLLHQRNLLDRIFIAIDWFVFPMLLARLVAVALGGALPPPLGVDPFDGSQLDWTGPWLLLEAILVLCVLVGYWAEEKRESFGMERESSGFGIGSRSLAIVMLSFGPAGFLAASSASIRSIRNSQPSGLGIALPALVVSCFSLAVWNDSLLDWFGEILLIIGAGAMFACALTVPLNLQKWTITLAIDGHLFVISGAIILGMVGGFELPLLLILMSTTVWVIGILQIRKALRIWGLFDLLLALLCSLVFASMGLDQYDILLGMTALALELGIIAWLGLSNQAELSKD